MIGMTNYISEGCWADIFLVWYVMVDDGYQALVRRMGRLRQRGPEPRFSDSEVITVALISETFFHGNEELSLAFIRQYHADLFPALVENSRFNRRRRQIAGVIEVLRAELSWRLIDPQDAVRLVDSAPLPVCTYMRGSQCTTVRGAEYCSVMVSRRAKLFGLRLHLSTTTEQVIDRWMLAPASHNDGTLAPALLEDCPPLYALGDNAFHNPTSAHWLQAQRQITLLGIPRHDAKAPWPPQARRSLNRIRRRIESTFSVLSTVFHLQQLGSRSFSGLLARVSTRLLAYTLSFFTSTALARL